MNGSDPEKLISLSIAISSSAIGLFTGHQNFSDLRYVLQIHRRATALLSNENLLCSCVQTLGEPLYPFTNSHRSKLAAKLELDYLCWQWHIPLLILSQPWLRSARFARAQTIFLLSPLAAARSGVLCAAADTVVFNKISQILINQSVWILRGNHGRM